MLSCNVVPKGSLVGESRNLGALLSGIWRLVKYDNAARYIAFFSYNYRYSIVPKSSWGVNFVGLNLLSLEDDSSTEMYWMGMS